MSELIPVSPSQFARRNPNAQTVLSAHDQWPVAELQTHELGQLSPLLQACINNCTAAVQQGSDSVVFHRPFKGRTAQIRPQITYPVAEIYNKYTECDGTEIGEDYFTDYATELTPVVILNTFLPGDNSTLKANFIYACTGGRKARKREDRSYQLVDFQLVAQVDFEQHGAFQSGHWHVISSGWADNSRGMDHHGLHLSLQNAPWIWETAPTAYGVHPLKYAQPPQLHSPADDAE